MAYTCSGGIMAEHFNAQISTHDLMQPCSRIEVGMKLRRSK